MSSYKNIFFKGDSLCISLLEAGAGCQLKIYGVECVRGEHSISQHHYGPFLIIALMGVRCLIYVPCDTSLEVVCEYIWRLIGLLLAYLDYTHHVFLVLYILGGLFSGDEVHFGGD